MKKTILAVLALASVVACNKSEVLEVAPQKAISFENPFINNSTKSEDPSWSADNMFTSFKVYGTLTNTATVTDATQATSTNIFAGIPVTENEGVWSYDEQYNQYWISGNTYNFAAVVANDANATTVSNVAGKTIGMPVSLSYNAKTQDDVLYAKSEEIVSDGDDSHVNFTFNHLLSKVKFNFTNTYTIDGYTVKVSNIQILNPYKTATVTFPNTWSAQAIADDFALNFGNADVKADGASDTNALIPNNNSTYSSTYERLLIPGTQELNIAFDVEVYQGSFLTDKYSYTSTNPVEVDVTLQPGYCYNFNAEIGKELKLITFDVKGINAWTPNDGQNVTVQ